MKKYIFGMLLLISNLWLSAEFSAQILGDVNNDQAIDIVDALMIAQYYVGLNPPGFQPAVADVDGNAAVTIVDALIIAHYYVGSITRFPAEPPVPSPTPGIPGVGPFEEDYRPKIAPPLITGGGRPPAPGGAVVTLSVDTGTVTRQIPPGLMGNNLGAWIGDNYLNNPAFTSRMEAINLPLCRFPGGSRSDRYHWNGEYPPFAVSQGWDNISNPWAVNTADFMTFMQRIGSLPMITVNHGYHSYATTATDGTVTNAAALAADWVEYCNAPDDGSNPNGGTDWAARRTADGFSAAFAVKYWEIGNEVYGSWETGYEADGAVYGSNFNVIYDAMKAVDPSIYIGICGFAGSEANRTWTAAVLGHPGTADRADFIDIHDYFFYTGQGGTISEEACLDLTEQLAVNKADLDYVFTNYTSRSPGEIPYYLGEFNMTNPENIHNIQLVAGLFVAKCLGEMIDLGYSASSLWITANATKDGDHGLLTRNAAVPDYTPNSFYYPYYFFTRNYGDKQLASSSSDTGVVVYASRFSGGEIGLVIINQTTEYRTAELNFSGFITSGDVNGWSLSGESLAASTCTLNGVGNGLTQGGPLLEGVLPYHWNVGSSSGLNVNLEANSVTSLVVY